ncbi:MAG: acyl-CoA dehydrogenase family protein [Deltaproteobacteria bacterium]|nr:acyl-CoA dehydrogenase family protein [Deltaproteobacteria bacterium]
MAQTAQSASTSTELAKGVAFLMDPVGSRPIQTPERFTEEQRLFHKSALDFLRHEVLPRVPEIEAKNTAVLLELFHKAGDLGFFSATIPTEYGGMGLDETTAMLISEAMNIVESWSVTLGAHAGIGTLPIVFFGNEAQCQKWLPKLATGEVISAYALTENNAGSDALSGRTRADLTPDGKHYILNGSKMFITNAGFADLFIVFAKIAGEKFTGFIVERSSEGLTVGPEEHKMGIRGSSTCPLILEDVLVPAENLLGEIGKGHKIAFNILNVGREKLGIGCIGAAKYALELSVKYAKDRKQFGKCLSEFELIQQKFAQMATSIYAAESLGYRTAGLMDARISLIAKGQPDTQSKVVQAIEEFAIEASILKVFGSEMLDDVADHAIQVHGGYGFVEEYQVERIARDSRVNRIFEGTNEINRMLIPGTILKRAMKGELPLLDFSMQIMAELQEPAKLPKLDGPAPLDTARGLVECAKRATVYAIQAAAQTYMQALGEQQEVLARLADMVIACYAMDSAVARAGQADTDDARRATTHREMANLFAHEAYESVLREANWVLESIAEGDALAGMKSLLKTLPERPVLAVVKVHRAIAAACIETNGYPLV